MTSRTLNYDAATFKASAVPCVPEERLRIQSMCCKKNNNKKNQQKNKNPLKAHHYWSDNSSKTLFDLRAEAPDADAERAETKCVLLILLMWP